MSQNTVRILVIIMSLVLVSFALGLAIFLEPIHDHAAYLVQWNDIVATAGSSRPNAYGPTHNFFAIPYAVHYKLPKIIFTLLWLASSIALVILVWKNESLIQSHRWILLGVILFNPLFWIFGFYFGSNDIVMASLALVSVLLYVKKNDVLSGCMLAIAIGVKFIPLAILPFLAINRGEFRCKFVVSTLVSLALLFGISFFVLPDHTLYPFDKAVSRHSKYLSIFHFFRGMYSPLHLFFPGHRPNIDWLSMWLCGTSLAVWFFVHIRYKLDAVMSCVASMLLVLTFYKVGHHQFYITLVSLTVVWISLSYSRNAKMDRVLLSFYFLVAWIALCSVMFIVNVREFRHFSGLPTFCFSIWFLVEICKHARNEYREPKGVG